MYKRQEEYEDIENEYSECESCHSKEKTNSLFYAQSKGYIKKHENDYGFAGLDGTGAVSYPHLDVYKRQAL